MTKNEIYGIIQTHRQIQTLYKGEFMKTFHEEIPDLCQDALTDQLFDEHSIFFDIETTGFSPANSTLYMIGCARRKSNRICIDQFLLKNRKKKLKSSPHFSDAVTIYHHHYV